MTEHWEPFLLPGSSETGHAPRVNRPSDLAQVLNFVGRCRVENPAVVALLSFHFGLPEMWVGV